MGKTIFDLNKGKHVFLTFLLITIAYKTKTNVLPYRRLKNVHKLG